MRFYVEIDLDDGVDFTPEDLAEAIQQEISCVQLPNGDLVYLNDVRVDVVSDYDDSPEALAFVQNR